MKTNLIKQIGRALPLLTALALTSIALGADAKQSMCVKQNDGTYKCKASGKTMKEPCCTVPSGESKAATPKPK